MRAAALIVSIAIPALASATSGASDADVATAQAKCPEGAPCAPEESSYNWAREYVELRVQAMNARALGAEVAGLLAEARIVGGRPAKPNSHPFQVGLLFKSVTDDFFAQYCGGALVASNFVVTAAHCSDFVVPGDVQVLTGTQSLNGSGVRRDVARIVVHPGWNPDTFDSDIAVWELTSHAAGIPVAKLARRDPRAGKKLLATGWGDTEAFGYPLDLMEVKVPLVARSNCNDRNSYDGLITSHMICAGRDAGGRDTCQGDSGGPLTRKKGGTFKELVGITSWGAGCADPNLFGVYTRVSEFRDFVQSIIR